MTISFDGVITIINGIPYSRTALAKYLELIPNTVYAAFKRFHNNKARELWIRKKRWLQQEGLGVYNAVYEQDGFFITVKQIVKQTHLTTSGAIDRGKKFEAGIITKQQLLKIAAARYFPKREGVAQWGALTNKSRHKNLEKIPDPTEFEYEVEQQSTNQCLPGLANNIMKGY